MQYNELGRTGIEVSRICLGTMTWGEQNTQAQAHEQLDYALSQGVNFTDTAQTYPVPPNQETYTITDQYTGATESTRRSTARSWCRFLSSAARDPFRRCRQNSRLARARN